jgi:hypothetical protein
LWRWGRAASSPPSCSFCGGDERTERRELITKLFQVQADAIEAENGMTKALSAIAAKLKVEA